MVKVTHITWLYLVLNAHFILKVNGLRRGERNIRREVLPFFHAYLTSCQRRFQQKVVTIAKDSQTFIAVHTVSVVIERRSQLERHFN